MPTKRGPKTLRARLAGDDAAFDDFRTTCRWPARVGHKPSTRRANSFAQLLQVFENDYSLRAVVGWEYCVESSGQSAAEGARALNRFTVSGTDVATDRKRPDLR